MAELANKTKGCDSLLDRAKKQWDKCKKDTRVWGNLIYENADYDSDGNAAAFQIQRTGGVVGIDKPTKDQKNILGFQFAFAESELNTYRAEAKANDFNFGIYHHRKLHNVFTWKNFLGMGIQDYKTKRTVDNGMSDYVWIPDNQNIPIINQNVTEGHYGISNSPYKYNTLNSSYRGYTFYANTELARPFILGTCKQYMIKPYASVNLIGTWQNAATEYGNFTNARFIQLDFLSASNIKTFGQLGLDLERNGDCLNLHAGIAYNFQLGGRHYTNVNNQFDFAGDKFNIRSTDTGNDYLNLNCGTELYISKKKNKYLMLNYQSIIGKNVTSQNVQLGYQHKF
jgi:uncharacterized protein with beta-barrel porin domain